jgi:hypothetical protein
VVEKFERLSTPYASPSRCREIVDAVANLEKIQVRELTGLLTLMLKTHHKGADR